MDAIGTVTNLASYTLATLGVIIAVLALWGIKELVDKAKDAAERIANNRFDSYVRSQEFQLTLQDRIDKAVEARWQEAQLRALREDDEDGAGGDFPAPPEEVK